MDAFDACSGLQWTRQVLDVEIGLSTSVYECQTGLYGYEVENSKYNCQWNDYNPELFMYSKSYAPKHET